MNKAVIALAVVLAGGLGYWLWSHGRTPKAVPPPPAPVAQPAAPPVLPAVDARPAGQILHPIAQEPRPTRNAKPLPSLDDSDKVMRERFTEWFGRRLGEFFISEEVIRRIVATVDNLPRERVAPDQWPIRPVPGKLLVDNDTGGPTLSPKNSARYSAHVALAESVPPRKLVDVYIRYYPLFQTAYGELGYPSGYFNDRLIEVIDHLLATPETSIPIRLAQPSLRFEYANDDLQNRSVGQKALLRMGPENAGRIKNVLREIRREITERRRR